MSLSNIAFIPARSGSKRLPNKNILKLNGVPLVCWSLKSFLDSNCFDKVILSSDSLQYYDIAREFIASDKLEFHYRTSDQAGDKVKIFDYIRDHFDEFCDSNDTLAMGLPTAPLRTATQISNAFDLSNKNQLPVFSATTYDFSVNFAFNYNNKLEKNNFNQFWGPLLEENTPMLTGNTRSQDQIEYLHPNGAIYVLPKIVNILQMKTFYDGSIPFIMDQISSIDIDTKLDFDIASAVLNAVK